MCRLVAYRGDALPLRTLVFGGEHSLYRQSWEARELLHGSVSVDGYGVAWPDEGADRQVVRLAHVEPLWHDPDLPDLLGSIRVPLAVAALRNATPGLPVGRTGLLPMIHDRWAMAMNGFVPHFRLAHMRALRRDLSDRWYGELVGSSDAETLFLLVRQLLDEGVAPDEALLTVRRRVARRIADDETAPLTLILMGPPGITVLHSTVNGPCNSLYLLRKGGLAPEGVLVASEALDDDDGWTAVPRESLVRIAGDGVAIRRLES